MLTKFDPLPNAQPGIMCDADWGAVFGNMTHRAVDVRHINNCIRVADNGPEACFNISSIVQYDTEGKYRLQEIEVFSIH